MNILTDRALPTPRVAPTPFTDAVWTEILGHLTDVVGPEASRYAKVPAAKLIAAMGYLAGSEDPDRFAVSNLLTFHAATKARALFNHRPSDDHDVLRRLATLRWGTLADRRTLDYGMTLLAYISLSDHEHDVAADRAAGKYNPVAEGRWNLADLKETLTAQIQADPQLEAAYAPVFSLTLSPLGFWSY